MCAHTQLGQVGIICDIYDVSGSHATLDVHMLSKICLSFVDVILP